MNMNNDSKVKMLKFITMISIVTAILNVSSNKLDDDIEMIYIEDEFDNNDYIESSNEEKVYNKLDFIYYEVDEVINSINIDDADELIKSGYSLTFLPKHKSLDYTFDLSKKLDNMQIIDIVIPSYIYQLEEKEIATYELVYDNSTKEFISAKTTTNTNSYFNKVLVGYYPKKLALDASDLDYDFNYELYSYIFSDKTSEKFLKSVAYPKFNIDFSNIDNSYKNSILMSEIKIFEILDKEGITIEAVLKEDLLIDNNKVNDIVVNNLTKKYR